jgi:alpha-L-fucosidase
MLGTRRHFLKTSVAGMVSAAVAPQILLRASEAKLPSHLMSHGGQFVADPDSDPRAASLAWFRDARFGLFIHYGLFSIEGIHPFEQYKLKIPVREYEKKGALFTAEKFDAGALCDLALAAGMKYVTLVCKHCEGFCLWNTRQTPFNSVNSAAKRDLVGEMVQACNQRGLGFFAFYEYGYDWHHPHGPRYKDFKIHLAEVPYPTPEPTYASGQDYDLNHYIDYAHAQIEELLTNYGPIAGIWLDGVYVPLHGDPQKFRCQELYDKIHKLQPHALVSFKFGITGTEDFNAPEVGQLRFIRPGDTKFIETCDTLSGGWGYVKTAKHHNADWVMKQLAFTQEKKMNFLLNTGPLADGSVFPDDEKTLKEVGRLLREQGWPKGASDSGTNTL